MWDIPVNGNWTKDSRPGKFLKLTPSCVLMFKNAIFLHVYEKEKLGKGEWIRKKYSNVLHNFHWKKKILQSWLNSYSQENTIVNISMFKYAQVFFLKIYFGFFNWLLLSMGERHMGQIVNKYPLNRNFTQKIHYLDLETWFKFHAHHLWVVR